MKIIQSLLLSTLLILSMSIEAQSVTNSMLNTISIDPLWGAVFLLLVFVLSGFIYRSFRQKKQLNEELEQLSIVARETDNGVLICGPNGEIEWSNAGLTRLIGFTFEELKQRGNTIEELSSNPDIKHIINQSIKNKKSSTYQLLNITKDGNERWIQSTLTPIIDEEGNVKKLVVIDTDISERKKIEEQLSAHP
ncbi:MAG: PAS domain-containing protein [Bacteroidetes bacterium]|nr:PAS domain-containing protein [Bacteroidota bacterium]